MQRDIGSLLGLYPTPVTIIGTVVDGTVNWSCLANLGQLGLDHIFLSIHKDHYTATGIRKQGTASVSLVSQEMLRAADYVGSVSGADVDKSGAFPYHMGKLENTPVIDVAPLVMECRLVDIYAMKDYDNFILEVIHTHVQQEFLNPSGVPDYEKMSPILFELPAQSYLYTGKTAGRCWSDDSEFTGWAETRKTEVIKNGV
ncbi:MAG: flavin reductase family protein [Oscillospiraceae bacterium]|nr:flavin reductase family protein [Oscillospiraceae bacterium]